MAQIKFDYHFGYGYDYLSDDPLWDYVGGGGNATPLSLITSNNLLEVDVINYPNVMWVGSDHHAAIVADSNDFLGNSSPKTLDINVDMFVSRYAGANTYLMLLIESDADTYEYCAGIYFLRVGSSDVRVYSLDGVSGWVPQRLLSSPTTPTNIKIKIDRDFGEDGGEYVAKQTEFLLNDVAGDVQNHTTERSTTPLNDVVVRIPRIRSKGFDVNPTMDNLEVVADLYNSPFLFLPRWQPTNYGMRTFY